MELQFDKEIDAILRKARGAGALAITATASPHIDADTIAAFAENALPQKAKLLYMEHFADCDRCRRMLSQTMLLNSEADATAASPVFAPVVTPAAPWYQKLFKTQNLALAMGALVLTFGGILGFLVLQNRNADVTVSQITEPQPRPASGPSYSEDSANAATNTVANTAIPQTNSAAASAPLVANSAPSDALPGEVDENRLNLAGRVDSEKKGGIVPDSGVVGTDADKAKEVAKPGSLASTAQPAPPPAAAEVVGGARAENKDDAALKNETSREVTMAKRKQAESERSRDAAPAPSKSGPVRSGPINTQSNQIQNQVFDMPVTRTVGGKTFNNRNGAWYDSAYKGQATNNFRRGTSEYKKLDGGLRNIADTLGGTVVVVWKDKAYRIQ